MARYEFVCDCLKEIIIEQSIYDELKLPKCVCGRIMRRHYDIGAIIFKGDGWAKKE